MTNVREMIEALSKQRDGIRDWICAESEYVRTKQDHLVENSPERAYWHHGYQAALDDMIHHLYSASNSSARILGRTN